MIMIQIGDASARRLADANARWIREQIMRRQRDGQRVCVRIDVDVPGIRVLLPTLDCPVSGGGGGRPATPRERRIMELWDERVAHKHRVDPEAVIAFLSRLEDLV